MRARYQAFADLTPEETKTIGSGFQFVADLFRSQQESERLERERLAKIAEEADKSKSEIPTGLIIFSGILLIGTVAIVIVAVKTS